VALFLLATSLRGIAGFYTDYLFFDSLGLQKVWSGVLGARIALGLIFTGLFFVLLLVNLIIADRLAPKFRPAGPEEELLERYHQAVGRRSGAVRVGVALLFAVIAGSGVSSQWNSWILFTHRVDFGVTDPRFRHRHRLLTSSSCRSSASWSTGCSPFIIIFIVTAVAHYLNGGIRVQALLQRVTPRSEGPPLGAARHPRPHQSRRLLAPAIRAHHLHPGVVEGLTDVNAQLPPSTCSC
jgi:hypothetical protein